MSLGRVFESCAPRKQKDFLKKSVVGLGSTNFSPPLVFRVFNSTLCTRQRVSLQVEYGKSQAYKTCKLTTLSCKLGIFVTNGVPYARLHEEAIARTGNRNLFGVALLEYTSFAGCISQIIRGAFSTSFSGCISQLAIGPISRVSNLPLSSATSGHSITHCTA